MAQQYIPITGIKPADPNNPPPRRDMKDWFEEGLANPDGESAKQVSLFIQALRRFQDQPFVGNGPTKPGQLDPRLSFVQIAGIHGLPVNPWDNTGNGFFCSHGIATFPTWHRPYLVLYEQTIYLNMLDILNELPAEKFKPYPKAEWEAAAANWRLPYWDYALYPELPMMAALPTIPVLNPEGGVKTFDPNPLYKYRTATGTTMGDFPKPYNIDYQDGKANFNNCKATNRYALPGSQRWTDGFSDNQAVLLALQNHNWPNPKKRKSGSTPRKAEGTIKENVYRLLQPGYFQSWRTFASTAYYQNVNLDAKEWLSLENLHNMIHGWTGGGGHMSEVEVAAFDPIFWHHHCFIDLIFASWQKVTQDEHWFDDPLPNDPKPTDSLEPFHVDQNNLFNSDDTRYISKFGYTYDYFYSHDDTVESLSANTDDLTDLEVSIVDRYSTTRSEVLDLLPSQKQDNDLVINVRYNPYGYNDGKPFLIHAFVGPVGGAEDPRYDPNRVGSVYNFRSQFRQSGCENCKDQVRNKVQATGQIPITGAIIKDYLNDDIVDFPLDGPFNEATLGSYLQKHLTWKVVDLEGAEIPIEPLGLKVFVMLGDAKHSKKSTVPSQYSNYTPIWSATQNKVGGGQQGDL